MGDGRFLKVFVPVLAFGLGILAGAVFFQGLTESGVRKAMLWLALLAITGALVAVRSFMVRRRVSRSAGTEAEDRSEVGFVVDTFHDVVARLKEKEDELRELKSRAEDRAARIEAYNENILQSVPSGVISVDGEGIIRSVNAAAERILGMKAADLIEKGFEEMLGSRFEELTRDGRETARQECRYTTPGGMKIWLGVTSSDLKNSDGEKIGTILVFTDLTDIKNLRQQVELRNRLSQLGEVSAGIAHELRNAMSVVTGYARLLRNKVEPSLGPTADAIINEIKEMDRVITDLLSFARPTVVNREPVGLADVLDNTLSSLPDSGGKLKVDLDIEDGLIVHADPSLLRQAFSNICLNAIAAMGGEGTLGIRAAGKGDTVAVTFTDTGPGIPADLKEKVFLPFFTTRQEGTGLGLAIVQKIIVSHGGNIEIDDAAGGGAVFRITLPSG